MEKEMDFNETNRLQELNGSDFEIVDNEPSIIGWTIKDEQGRTIGEVDDLIFDAQTRKVRYIVMDLEGNVLDLEPRDVLVPIGIAELHPSDNDLILPGITADHLRPLPLYKSGSITRDIENAVLSAFSTVKGAVVGAANTVAGAVKDVKNDVKDDFYSHEHFNENRTFSSRPSPARPLINEESDLSKKESQTSVTDSPRIVEKRNITAPNTNVTDQNKNLNNPNTNVTDLNKPNLNDPNSNVTDPNKNLTGPNTNVTDPNQNLNDPNKNVTDPNKNLNVPNQNLNDPNKNLNDPNKNLHDPNKPIL